VSITLFTLLKTTMLARFSMVIDCYNRTEPNCASLTVLGPPNVAMPAQLNTIAVMVSI